MTKKLSSTAEAREGEGEGEGEGEKKEAAASRVTLSYQSTREVVAKSHDSRATVDISAETDVRVCARWRTVGLILTYFIVGFSGEEGGEGKVSAGVRGVVSGCGLISVLEPWQKVS